MLETKEGRNSDGDGLVCIIDGRAEKVSQGEATLEGEKESFAIA